MFCTGLYHTINWFILWKLKDKVPYKYILKKEEICKTWFYTFNSLNIMSYLLILSMDRFNLWSSKTFRKCKIYLFRHILTLYCLRKPLLRYHSHNVVTQHNYMSVSPHVECFYYLRDISFLNCPFNFLMLDKGIINRTRLVQ